MISVEVITDTAAREALSGQWQTLTEGSFASAFTQPAWYNAWASAFGASHPTLIAAFENGELVGILPLGISRPTLPNLFLPFVVPYARGDYQPFLVVPNRQAEIVPKLLEAAFAHFRKESTFLFPSIPSTDPSLPVLRDWLRSKGYPTTEELETVPRMRTKGMTYEQLEKTWPANHRKEVRRRLKRLAEQGEVSLWRPSSVEETMPVLHEFFEVHDEKWLSQGYPGRFQEPRHRKHFEEIVMQLWGKGLFFSTVRCGDINISFQLGFQSDGWIQSYRRTYRLNFHAFSPGTAHIALLSEYVCQENLQGVDFLRGEEPHKYRWSNESHDVIDITCGRRSSSTSYFWLTKGKPYTRRTVGRYYMLSKAKLQDVRRKIKSFGTSGSPETEEK